MATKKRDESEATFSVINNDVYFIGDADKTDILKNKKKPENYLQRQF